ncbi:MAG: MFS transporter [Rhizobiales bacterium]|nr:MFS transporter [Hyphomicrobiales bacterium]
MFRGEGNAPPSGRVSPRSSALAPFRIRSFQLQWPADLFTAWAFEMETLILGWYILAETGSVFMLTLFGALQYLGTLIAPMLGVAGDRAGHRNVLAAMRGAYTVLAASLLLLSLAGQLQPLVVLVLAMLNGLVRPSDQGMRAALMAETMPPAHLIPAASISRTTTDSARIAGALLGAGLFAAAGMTVAYVAVTTIYAIGLVLTLCIPRVPRAANVAHGEASVTALVQRPSPWRDLREGIAYIWRTPHLLACMWLACLVNLSAFPLTGGLLPYVARDIYHTHQTGLGYMAASFAGGALCGSILMSLAGGRMRPARMMLIFGAGWYAALLVFAQTSTLVPGLFALFLTGLVQSFSMVPLTVLLLRTAGDRFRGRVMGVRMMAIYTLPLGLLAAGALTSRIGFTATATLYAVSGIVCVALIAALWRKHLWPLDAPGNDL